METLMHKSKLFILWFIVFAVISSSIFSHTSLAQGFKAKNPDASRVTGTGQYHTSLGKLSSGFLLQKNSDLTITSSGKFSIDFGFITIGKNEGLSVQNSVDIYTGHTNLTPCVTFVMDNKTREWIATDGVMCMEKEIPKLLNNSTVKIVGGKDKPIKIGGKPFAATTVTIKGGRPIESGSLSGVLGDKEVDAEYSAYLGGEKYGKYTTTYRKPSVGSLAPTPQPGAGSGSVRGVLKNKESGTPANNATVPLLKEKSKLAANGKVTPGPKQIRFTKAQNGVITDQTTGLEWYIGPDRNTDWKQAKSWTESLTAAGGGWRMPTIPELRSLYQKGAGPNNMDPLFQTAGFWVWSGQLKNASSAWSFLFSPGQENSAKLVLAGNGRAFAVRGSAKAGSLKSQAAAGKSAPVAARSKSAPSPAQAGQVKPTPKPAVVEEVGGKYGLDEALSKAAFAKAKELGRNAILIYAERGGINYLGGRLNPKTKKIMWYENDMVINAGDLSLSTDDLTLSKGEYAIVKNGKFVKQAGKITAR
jgi:hypothetical protein